MKKILAFLLFSAGALFLFLFLLDKIPLWSSDEGRFGEIAREIWESGSFVPLRFNYVDYLQKPVLSMVLAALSYTLFGVTNLTARLPSVVSGLLGILVCYAFARRLFDERTAAFSAAVLLTSMSYMLLGRFAMIDMLMTFLLSACLFSLMIGCLEKKRKYYLLAYVLMGLAFLTKGLIGLILPALTFLTFLLWTRNLGEIKRMSLGWGIFLIGIIILPWAVSLSLKKPDFLKVFFLEHQFARFATKSFGRIRPFWFFAAIFLGLWFPWSLWTPASLVHAIRKRGEEGLKVRFLISWMAVIFIFFTLPRTKLHYYILPLSMPVALLVGRFFSDRVAQGAKLWERERLVRWTWKLILLVCLVGPLGANLFVFLIAKDAKTLALRPVIPPASLAVMTGSVFAFFFHKRSQERRAFLALSAMTYLALLATFAAMLALSPYESTFAFAEALKPSLREGDAVAIFSSPDHFSDFPFHLRRRVIVVGSDRGSLTDESRKPEKDKEMKRWFLGVDDLVHLFDSKQNRVFCLLDEKNFHYLQEAGLKDFKVLKSGHRKLLISNT